MPKKVTIPQSHLDICDRFKLIRLQNKLTQKDFGEKTGLNISYIKNIEVRNFTPNLFAIKQLRKEFNVNYDWLLDGTGTPIQKPR